jgi:uncharacterized phage infection (PIP) family protein YhgE
MHGKYQMKCHQLLLTITGATMLTLLAKPSHAVPAMDIRAEDLIRKANEIKTSLNMTPNQLILWQQVQTKVNRILQSRMSRRGQLQADIKLGLGNSKAELRDLANKLNAEEDLSNQENKQLRELWLAMNDALDDNQQQIVLDFLIDQLERSPAEKSESARKQGNGHARGMERQRSGGMNVGFP